MSDCQRCGARANNAFLCRGCTTLLARLLGELPWWLDRLTEAAVGQTRMSDNGGRRSAKRRDLDGDRELAACIERLPEREDDLEKARAARQKAALAHALASGGVDARASELLASVDDSLRYWVRVLCEARGLEVPRLKAGRALGLAAAHWLRVNVSAITASEDAGDICGDIETAVEDIVRVVNRPVKAQFLGHCPAWDEEHRSACGYRLRALPEALEVTCRSCRTTHNVNRLLLAMMDHARRETLTWDELLRVNRGLPDGYSVPERTLRHWKRRGRIKPSAWVRHDTGRVTPTWHTDDDVALYRWGDVERLRTKAHA